MRSHTWSGRPRCCRAEACAAGARGRHAARGVWSARTGVVLTLALCTLLLGACAKSSDVEKIDSSMQKVAETDRVQNQRLSSLENDVGKALATQSAQLKQLSADVKNLQQQQQSLKGRTSLLEQSTQQITNEQQTLSNSVDRSTSDQRKLGHLVSGEVAKIERFRLNTSNDLDKMRTEVAELEKLLKSPIANLPDKTVADRDLRRAYYHLLSGEFDIAVDRFAAWEKKYPKDPRVPEAEYRQGEAYFLMRRYDHALIPLYELVHKYPKSQYATPARWMVARSLEETGDLKLAREFYAQLINQDTPYAADATRRVAFINRLYPHSAEAAKGKAKQ